MLFIDATLFRRLFAALLPDDYAADAATPPAIAAIARCHFRWLAAIAAADIDYATPVARLAPAAAYAIDFRRYDIIYADSLRCFSRFSFQAYYAAADAIRRQLPFSFHFAAAFRAGFR